MEKCNFKEEANYMFSGNKAICKLTNEECSGEDKCILFISSQRDKK